MKVSLNAMFLAGPLGAILLALCVNVFYAWHDARTRPKKRQFRLYRCARCRHVYEDARNVPLAACPLCGTLNEAVRR